MTARHEDHEDQTPADAASARVSAGRIGRPHGLDGSFYVTGAKPRLLALGTLVSVAGHAAEIVRRAGTEQRPILRLAGVEDRTGAEALRGAELLVDSLHAPTLGEGEWWEHELQGCEVRDGDARLGTVTRLIELPSCEALEVSGASGGEPLLVPMVKDAIRAIDPAARRIEVNAEFLGLSQGANAARGSEDAGGEP